MSNLYEKDFCKQQSEIVQQSADAKRFCEAKSVFHKGKPKPERLQVKKAFRSERLFNDELGEYHESRKENVRCKEFMDNLVRERYNGMSLPANDIVADTVKEFGYDRTMWVIAATIQSRSGDGRFAIPNRKWANSFFMPDNQKYEYGLRSDSGLVDMLAKYVQQQYNSLGLYDSRHCTSEEDYTNQIVVLKAEWLKEEYKTPENQLFLATGGFGCDPNSSGTQIFGKFLNDGEEVSVRRYDVCGVISPEHLPEWASKKAAEILSPAKSEYENQVVTLDKYLHGDMNNPDTQLFLVTSENSDGTCKTIKTISGMFLHDGTYATVRSTDVRSIVPFEQLPEWASAKVERQLATREESNTVQIEDNEDEDCFEM